MILTDQTESNERYTELYSFLDTFDHKWVDAFFPEVSDFILFPEDNGIRVFVWKNERNEICGAMLMEENAILTAAFSPCAGTEVYSAALGAAESCARELHYTTIWFGDGDYSFGLFSEKDAENGFSDFLKANGFVLESDKR